MNRRESSGNAAGMVKMIGVALVAFIFSFSMVPLYRIACEKVFGVRLEKGPVDASTESSNDTARWVTVQFAEQMSLRVHPGRQNEAK
jgi:cytochrome c oxidase assembly protein subunit 11